MFCSECGNKIPNNATSCPACGTPCKPIPQRTEDALPASREVKRDSSVTVYKTRNFTDEDARQLEEFKAERYVAEGVPGAPAPGYSKLARHADIRRAVRGDQHFRIGCMGALLTLPMVIVAVMMLLDDDSEGLRIVAIIWLASIVFGAVVLKISEFAQRTYDGEVVGHYVRWAWDSNDEGGADKFTYVTEFKRDKDGTIVEISDEPKNPRWYAYLDDGDRVRCHPRLSYGYEKYDKSHDRYVICWNCGERADITKDACPHCGKIELK